MGLKIDMHTHILPPELPDYKSRFGYGGFPTLRSTGSDKVKHIVKDNGQFFREIHCNCFQAKPRIEDCDAAGVDVQVLSTVPVMFNYWAPGKDALVISRDLNDHIAEVCHAHPKRFLGLGTVPLQEPDLAIAELERCMDELGLLGIEMGTHVDGWNLSDPHLFPFFEAAADLGAAIFIHPWDMMGAERMPKYWLPWLVGMPAEVSLAICSLIFGGVFERLPKLRVAFAHGGGSFGATLGRISHGFKARPDLCAVDNAVAPEHYLGRFFVDALVHDKLGLDTILERFGEDHILLGSDYPFPLGEETPGKLIETHLDKKVQEKILEAMPAVGWALIPPALELGMTEFQSTREFAKSLDEKDPLREYRKEFLFPDLEKGEATLYLNGNSLGLQPRKTRTYLLEELEDWAHYGVLGHLRGRRTWYSYHEHFAKGLAHLAGAKESEVVAMNTLTVNLHLMLVSFYRPEGDRNRILIERNIFPSDRFALESQIRLHGLEPDEILEEVSLDEAEVLEKVGRLGPRLALAMFGNVNYLTGEALDIQKITSAVHSVGAYCGWDLAHGIGNLPLELHRDEADFAVWCSYKYLNSGPGAVAGCFVHEKHGENPHIPRLLGWWSHDKKTRMKMAPDCKIMPGAEGWQISNPPIFSLTPLLASLEIFLSATRPRVLEKQRRLTGYLEFLLKDLPVEILTPSDPAKRGSQLSLRISGKPDFEKQMEERAVVCDFRSPDVIRVAPAPLYNSYEEVFEFVQRLRGVLE